MIRPNPIDKNVAKAESCCQILVADDDPVHRDMVAQILRRNGYSTIVVEGGRLAAEQFSDDILVALLDLSTLGADGLRCLKYAQKYFPSMQCILLSYSDQFGAAMTAMQFGATNVLAKPACAEQLVASVQRAMRTAKLSRDFQELKAAVGTPLPARSVSVAEHNASWQKQISKIAVSDSTLLLTGESGTGKSTLARTVHQQGPRASHPFVTVNCAALPRDLIEDELFGHCYGALTGAVSDRPGRTEIADGGTLFLDEVGDLPLELQPKLLKFLQERSSQRIGCNKVRQVDVRVIAATHQNLAEMCTKNRFREDLFYRLSVLQMFSKPLRERPQEIDRFATTILARIAHRSGKQPNRLTPDAASQLRGCHWPGNIRQLENVLEQACVIAGGSPIGVDDLELEDSGFVYLQTTNDPNGSLAGLTLSEIEVRAIVDTLSFCAGNKAKTARQLGISEKSIYNKMRRHGLRN